MVVPRSKLTSYDGIYYSKVYVSLPLVVNLASISSIAGTADLVIDWASNPTLTAQTTGINGSSEFNTLFGVFDYWRIKGMKIEVAPFYSPVVAMTGVTTAGAVSRQYQIYDVAIASDVNELAVPANFTDVEM